MRLGGQPVRLCLAVGLMAYIFCLREGKGQFASIYIGPVQMPLSRFSKSFVPSDKKNEVLASDTFEFT